LEVEQFEKCRKKSSKKYKQMAQRIYDAYILNNCYLEINLDDRVKRNITDQMSSENDEIGPCIFTEAKTSVYIMLEASFIRFLHTSAYQDMIKNCGQLSMHYDESVRNIALNYLTQYLRHQHDVVLMYSEDYSPLGDSLTDMNTKHYQLTKTALKGFIKDLFGLDYFSSSSSSLPTSNFSCSPKKFTHPSSAIKKIHKKKNLAPRS
jgi:hypothetical protein